MTTKLYSGLSLVSGDAGYSVVQLKELSVFASDILKEHVSLRLGRTFNSLVELATALESSEFNIFKEKAARLFSEEHVQALESKISEFFLFSRESGDVITDEEGLGYGNIYWRIVRANSRTDVGSVHTDRWFWDLNRFKFPDNLDRVKVWLPLLQDDANPSLMILPSSQSADFEYSFLVDEFGKRKPYFVDTNVTDKMIPAPVSVGQGIVFHDRLLHGGRSTSVTRISIEWTFGLQR